MDKDSASLDNTNAALAHAFDFTANSITWIYRYITMSLSSDLTLNVSKLRPESVSESEKQLTDTLVALTAKGPRWYDVCTTIKAGLTP